MNFKEFRKKNREKRKVFKPYILAAMATIIISFLLLVKPVEFGFDEVYVWLLVYLIMLIIFDKNYRSNLISLLKKFNNKVQNDNRN